MLEFKQSTQIRVPVRMLTSAGSPVPLLNSTNVTVTIEKADGTTSAFSPSGVQWVEITAGAFLNQGKYDLIVPNTFTDQTGPFSVAVAASGVNTFVGLFKIIAFESSDIYADLVQLRRLQEGHWKIFNTGPDANRLVLYSADGTTVLQKWNLFDINGTPTTSNIFERVPQVAIP